jgi:hypothetical protein
MALMSGASDVSPENDDRLNWSKMAASTVLHERSGSMKHSRFSEEQVIYALRQAQSGTPIGDLCRQYGITEQTFYAWKKK